eukprot:5601059-Alexandrium_andersonii.AAC.1
MPDCEIPMFYLVGGGGRRRKNAQAFAGTQEEVASAYSGDVEKAREEMVGPFLGGIAAVAIILIFVIAIVVLRRAEQQGG